ncbi:MAG: PorT family protein [Hymenobacter sp.]|nr:MAG: PorT family protein [Hymenobacter sp.]
MITRFFWLATSSVLLAGAAQAQAQAGLRAGGSLLAFNDAFAEHFATTASVQTRARLGYQVGVFYQVQLPESPYMSLVPEVQFSREQQAVTLTDVDAGGRLLTSDYRLRLDYLSVPLLLRVTLGPVQLEAGPQGSVLLGGRGEGTTVGPGGPVSSYYQPIDQPATGRYRRFDFGLTLGVGAKLPSGLGLSVRAYQGATQVNDGGYAAFPIPYSGSDEYRRTLQASLTYQLPARR